MGLNGAGWLGGSVLVSGLNAFMTREGDGWGGPFVRGSQVDTGAWDLLWRRTHARLTQECA